MPTQKGKKRARRSASPSSQRGSSTKRSRTTSGGPGMSMRAKSVFRGDRDPYFPRGEEPQSPPSDWTFRLKVICSDDTADGIFKEAIQGLVKICFPDNFLDELGVDVVEQHMRESNASEEKIKRMKEVFDAEMIHRCGWMLAKYLDSPGKMETGISSIIAATNRLHEKKPDREVLDDMIGAFQRLRDALPSDNSDHLASGGALSIPADTETDPSTVVRTSELPDTTEETIRNSEPLTPKKKIARDLNKVSKSWRWDVDPRRMGTDNVPLHFKKPTDLFAYHALPIIKEALGSKAPKAKIREKMDEAWSELSIEDAQRWQECFQKLKCDDLKMLERVSPHNRPEEPRATPFPRSAPAVLCNEGSPADTTQHHIKQEHDTEEASAEEAEGNVELKVDNEHPTLAVPTGPYNNGSNHPIMTEAITPIVDFVWGTHPFSHSDCQLVIAKIMSALNSRVPEEAITVKDSKGPLKTIHKDEVPRQIEGIFSTKRLFKYMRTRTYIEGHLRQWVMANPSSFAELGGQPFFFSHMISDDTPFVDFLCPPGLSTLDQNPSGALKLILTTLEVRGVDMTLRFGQKSMAGNLRVILDKDDKNTKWRRERLERLLRHIVFLNKHAFPEFKTSALVKEWEQVTGLTWG